MGARDDLYRFFPRTIHRGTHTRCDVLGQRPRWSRVTPTLLAAFFYFDMSFMVWVILGPLGVQIAAQLHLDAAQKGLMVALPVLAGALLRPVNGLLVDRLGPKRTGRADHRHRRPADRLDSRHPQLSAGAGARPCAGGGR